MTTYHDDVLAFKRKFNMVVGDKPDLGDRTVLAGRIDHLYEEIKEITIGYLDNNLPAVADGLVDLVYVAIGTAIALGLPWQDLWDDVQRANLEKVPGVHPGRQQAHDVIKPPGWRGPRTEEILREHGWEG